MLGTISNKKSPSSLNALFYAIPSRVRSGSCNTHTGMVSGTFLGRLNGFECGRSIDPAAEHEYWRESFHRRIYVDSPEEDYELYAPAYQFGWESYAHLGKDDDGYEVEFDDVEEELGLEWGESHDGDSLPWAAARPATRDAWERASYLTRQAALRMKPR